MVLILLLNADGPLLNQSFMPGPRYTGENLPISKWSTLVLDVSTAVVMFSSDLDTEASGFRLHYEGGWPPGRWSGMDRVANCVIASSISFS